MEDYTLWIRYVIGRAVILGIVGGVAAGILHEYCTTSPVEQRARDRQQEINDLRYKLDSLRKAREAERKRKDAIFVNSLTEIVDEL